MSLDATVHRPDVRAVKRVLRDVRETAPVVHCLTNIVVANLTANVLLAVGASPAMVENAEESAEFARAADALLVNLGTLSRERAEAMRAAAAAAHAAGTSWVLDPVAVGPLSFRTALAQQLLDHGPTVVRGNPSEVVSLTGASGQGRGVDSGLGPRAALGAAREVATRTQGAVAVSGPVDLVTDGEQVVEVRTGHPLMAQVTGTGCVLGAVTAACLAVEDSPLVAATAATSILTVAAEYAAPSSRGPGSFAVELVDSLARLDGTRLTARMGRHQ